MCFFLFILLLKYLNSFFMDLFENENFSCSLINTNKVFIYQKIKHNDKIFYVCQISVFIHIFISKNFYSVKFFFKIHFSVFKNHMENNFILKDK
jgi:hypothetical protein